LPIAQQQQVVELQPAPVAKPTPKVAVPTAKYGALKAVATVYRIIGWVLMVGGTLFSIALAVIAAQGAGAFSEFIPWSTGPGMVGIAIVGVVVSILFGLFLLAFADLCYVLIDIEINTRSED
jgi:succinate dehydrogenase/fumarate reductase cytochrome b subunit